MEDNQITFKGIDGAECEHFIQQIRRKARAANRSKDNDWITELVATCMAGSALRWYIRLDRDVAEDWTKLQKAMIDKWPGEEDGGEAVSSSIPTPAAALPTPAAAPQPTPASVSDTIGLMVSLSLNTTKTGYIRVNVPGSGRLFVSATLSNLSGRVAFGTCASRSQAMIVQFTHGCVHVPVSFVILNSQSNFKDLVLAQDGKGALGPASIDSIKGWAMLTTADEHMPINGNDSAMARSMVWSICPVDNSIRALWSAGGSDYRLTTLLGSSTGRLGFVSNAKAFRAKYQQGVFTEVDLTLEEI